MIVILSVFTVYAAGSQDEVLTASATPDDMTSQPQETVVAEVIASTKLDFDSYISEAQAEAEVETEVAEEDPEEETQEAETNSQALSISSDDQQRLMKIAYAEARGEGVECMALIMCVVLNRVENEGFPNTIEGVITESGQFTPVSNGSYASATPDESTQAALDLVLSGWDESMGALYFESCNGESWHSRNLTYLFDREGIRFYR